jgi:predicted CoA-binding protein
VVNLNTEETILYILKNFKVIAVVGCSRDEAKEAHKIPKYLKEVGYKIIPINPNVDFILGEKAYPSLLEVKEKVEVVDVFRPAKEALEIAKQAKQIGAKAVWLQSGIISKEAEEFCKSNNILFVENRCMMVEHSRLKKEGKI